MSESPSAPVRRHEPSPADPAWQKEALDFYHVPGREPISEKDARRYIARKNALSSALGAFSARDAQPTEAFLETDVSILETELRSNDPARQLRAVASIRYLESADAAHLIRIALQTSSPQVRFASAEMLYRVDAEASYDLRLMISQLVREGLSSNNEETQKAAAGLIHCAAYQHRTALIELGLASTQADVQCTAARQVSSVLAAKDTPLIRSRVAALIERGFTDGKSDLASQIAYARMIRETGKDECAHLILLGFRTRHPEVQLACAQAISGAYRGERAALYEFIKTFVRKGFASSTPGSKKVYAEMIRTIPRDETHDLIEAGLGVNDLETQISCASYINFILPEEEMLRLIRVGLSVGMVQTQRICMSIVKNTVRLFQRYPEMGNLLCEQYPDLLIESGLYTQTDVPSEGAISRSSFKKTGSRTTLLSGRMRGKAVIRHITVEAFAAWQAAYENQIFWRENGFAYVPIEPIISFRRSAHGLVDVFSGVLDLSLAEWVHMGGASSAELLKDREEIIRTLEKTGVRHGHTHERNFCLRFFRDEHGKPDFDKKPRIYLIDFDQADS